MMQFRDVLIKLDYGRNSGWDHFDCMCVAGLIGCGVTQSSKWLFRLHRMGFLKKRRMKRRCISKGRRLCYKGFYYEYTFSRQGEKYVGWLKNTRPYEDALYSIMVARISSDLPEDMRKAVALVSLGREMMRFKGSNRSLSALGILAPVLLPLSNELSITTVKKEEAQKEYVRLREVADEQASKIMDLDKGNRSLKLQLELKRIEAEDKKNSFKKVYQETNAALIKRIISSGEHVAALESLSQIKSGIIKDLTETIAVMNPQGAPRLVDLVYKRYARSLTMVADYSKGAETTRDEPSTILNTVGNSDATPSCNTFDQPKDCIRMAEVTLLGHSPRKFDAVRVDTGEDVTYFTTQQITQ